MAPRFCPRLPRLPGGWGASAWACGPLRRAAGCPTHRQAEPARWPRWWPRSGLGRRAPRASRDAALSARPRDRPGPDTASARRACYRAARAALGRESDRPLAGAGRGSSRRGQGSRGGRPSSGARAANRDRRTGQTEPPRNCWFPHRQRVLAARGAMVAGWATRRSPPATARRAARR